MKNIFFVFTVLIFTIVMSACGASTEKEDAMNANGEDEVVMEEPDDPVVDTPEDLGGSVTIEGEGEVEEVPADVLPE
jgi:hypothetical protein